MSSILIKTMGLTMSFLLTTLLFMPSQESMAGDDDALFAQKCVQLLRKETIGSLLDEFKNNCNKTIAISHCHSGGKDGRNTCYQKHLENPIQYGALVHVSPGRTVAIDGSIGATRHWGACVYEKESGFAFPRATKDNGKHPTKYICATGTTPQAGTQGTTPQSPQADQQLVGKMVDIPAGSFRMGDLSDSGSYDEQPVHSVRISSFQMGVHEVTVGQFRAFVEDSGYDAGGKWRSPGFTQSDSHPVVYVSYDDVQAFIGWLNEKTSGNFRLPTEAEWEYAARAGTTSKYSWGDDEDQADAYAWYDDNSGGRTHAVGGKRANPWGLYDMHGNVWEWVQDWYDEDYYKNSPASDPQGPSSGRDRVRRGGGWYSNAGRLRSAFRGNGSPGGRHDSLGFRLMRQP